MSKCRYGLYAYNASYPTATLTLRGNTISPDSITYYRVGIRPDGKWQPTIVANRITGGYYGIDLTTTDGTVAVQIDSNVVTGGGYAALDLYYVNGPVTGLFNNIAGDSLYGIFNQYGTGSRSFTKGRFVGNKTYAVYNVAAGSFDATQNYWGDPAGVAGAAADTVYGNVDPSSFLTSDPGGVTVPLAPPVPSVIAGSAPSAPLGSPVMRPSPAAGVLQPSTDQPSAAQREAAREARRAAKDQERAARRPHQAPDRDPERPRAATRQRLH